MKPTRLSKARCVCLRSCVCGRGLQEIIKRACCTARQRGQTCCDKRVPGVLPGMPLLCADADCKLRRLSERSRMRACIERHRQCGCWDCVVVSVRTRTRYHPAAQRAARVRLKRCRVPLQRSTLRGRWTCTRKPLR